MVSYANGGFNVQKLSMQWLNQMCIEMSFEILIK